MYKLMEENREGTWVLMKCGGEEVNHFSRLKGN
jgi:hypothetical protein